MFFTETDELVDIRYDGVFKAVFTRDTPESQGALSKLVSALIGREVTIVSISANEPPIDTLRDRQIRYDINCKAENGELLNVEMGFTPTSFELVRLEFYAGRLFIAQDIRGDDKTYADLKPAYQITVLAKKRFFPDDVILHTFEYYDPVHGVSLNGKTRIITLELSKTDNVVEKPVKDMSTPEHWGVFFQYLTDKTKRETINEIIAQEEGIAMATEALNTFTKDEEEYFRKTSELKYELDTQTRFVLAKREARREGKREGEREGIEKGIFITAQNALVNGLSIEMIHNITGLDIETIKNLAKEQ